MIERALLLALCFSRIAFAWISSSSSSTRISSNLFSMASSSSASAVEIIDASSTRQVVSKYYGETLKTSADLQTNACCTGASPPTHIRDLLKNIADETKAKYYGCGLCLPNYNLEGARVLDLGCGAGRDVYLASQLVGASGSVAGVDMTHEQLQSAKDFQDYHADKFGYKNTEFYQGYLETLLDIPELEPNTFDVIISNCVINLCTDKPAVLKACYELLKPGGELYFSDVYTNRRVPMALQKNALLWGECLSGALYWNDFEALAKQAGFNDPRLVEDSPITIQNKNVAALVDQEGHGGLEFYSATYRLFKLPELEPACEDYGQAVIYKGTIPRFNSSWTLDKHHTMETGRVFAVCGNTYKMLRENPRLAPHFDFIGTWDRHYGLFEGCGGGLPFNKSTSNRGGKGDVAAAASCC
ncbi:hypothetical protein MPSEU_000082800 [Mayamaea pseudoterrestris]|nr:hypothetical protein MPSEU_000082800 [Mayamaea pseudoterrestris]